MEEETLRLWERYKNAKKQKNHRGNIAITQTRNSYILNFSQSYPKTMSEIPRIREESHTFSIREPINIVLQFNGCNISVSTFTRVCRHANYIDRVKNLHQAITNEERYRTNELMENQRFEIDEFPLKSFCEI
ncbi:hypothetical protein V1477_019491 [Vespula maculifrons]|uniref:SWIM-type domain-containing protein n=1 Tax=Vespula maculifrons TaxID=7453 RepID=A0ABD2ATB1_VESMC